MPARIKKKKMVNKMPRGNRTGPRGDGPMTGRGAGQCAGFDRPGYASSGTGRGYGREIGYGQGRGRGFGRGQGMGYGRGFREPDRTIPVYKEPSPEDEKKYLEIVVTDLEAELENVKTRINELAKEEK